MRRACSPDVASITACPRSSSMAAVLLRTRLSSSTTMSVRSPRGSGGHLDLYYRDCVIGGLGAFMVPIRERQQFVEAVRTKLVREISDYQPPPLIEPAQSEPRITCFAGEIASDRWMRN